VSGLTAGTYDVYIRPVYVGGFTGAWSTSPSCLKIIGSALRPYEPTEELQDPSERFLLQPDATTVEAIVYPNPTNGDDVQLLLNGYSGLAQVKVFDMAGNVVYADQINVSSGNAVRLNFASKLSCGLYHVLVTTDNETLKRKLMVMH
jgi:hypothetical protein